MTDAAPLTAGQKLRAFLRAHPTDAGMVDALDALHELEGHAQAGEREAALSAALVGAQQDATPIYKTHLVDLREGKGSYKVADTEQAIQVAREALGKHGLMVSCTEGTKTERLGGVFLMIEFEVRHERGGAQRSRYEWPIVYGAGERGTADVERRARTSALGYYLRDLLLLPRLKDEAESAQQDAPRSGPVKRPGAAAAPKEQNVSPRAQSVIDAIKTAKTLDVLDKAESKVADLASALESGADPGYTHAEVSAMNEACRKRRAEMEGPSE